MKSRISSLFTAVAVVASVSRVVPADAQTGPTSFPTSDVESSYLPTYDSSSEGTYDSTGGGTPSPSPMEDDTTTTLPPIVDLISAPSTGSPEAASTATDPPAVAAEPSEPPVAPVPTSSVTEAPAGAATVSPVGSGGPVTPAENTSSSSSSSSAAAVTAASLCVATTAAAAVWTMY